MSALVWVGLALLSGALGAEIVGWSATLQRVLIRYTAAALPRSHAERYVEEWYAELDELPNAPITRLLWVFSLVLRRAALARELGVARSVVGFAGGVKRCIDIALTTFGLVAISPLLAAIALAIKLDDKGPVFVRQTRIGQDGSTFSMLKYRTFTLDAEQRLARLLDANPNGMLFKLPDDPRVSPLGRLLRKFSLDELPQLVNVLLGDMSLVGPRPSLPQEVEMFDADARRKLEVVPGMTCLWQVTGLKSLRWKDVNRLDARYVDDWSIALDLLILWKTVVTVLRR